MKEVIKDYSKQLRWGNSIVRNYGNIDAETHEEFLTKLLEMEVKTREVQRKNRCLRQANFDVIKTFSGYSFDHIEIPASILGRRVKNRCSAGAQRKFDSLRSGGNR